MWYCTPGQICSAVAVLDEIKRVSPVMYRRTSAHGPATNMEMRERMSGNLCRCGAYSNIAEAMEEVAGVTSTGRRSRAFSYERARSPAEAAKAVAGTEGAKFLAEGTNLLDLMKLEVETPAHLVDVQDIGLDRIEPTDEGGLRIGTLVTNTALASHERACAATTRVLTRAIVAGASGSCATRPPPAGNLQQCAARGVLPADGRDRHLGQLHRDPSGRHGGILRVLDASIQTVSGDGSTRSIPIADFHRSPATGRSRTTCCSAVS